MKNYVFDECLDSKKVISRCNMQVLCVAERYPKHLKGVKDEDMLPEILAGNASLVTTDHLIARNHSAHIPEENAGIIIVRLRRPAKKMTDTLAAHLLSNFKAIYPGWENEDWRGLCVEITETDVVISKLPSNNQTEYISANYDSPDAENKLRFAINSLRTRRISAR